MRTSINLEREAIGRIFDVAYPINLGDRWLCDQPADEESWPSVRDFEAILWMDIDSEFWHGRESAMSYFSSVACRYYLPSVIASSYEDFEGIELVTSSVIGEWAGLNPLLNERRDRRWKSLERIQRGFLVSWVMSMRRRDLTMLNNEVTRRAVEFLVD